MQVKPDASNNNYKSALEYLYQKETDAAFMTAEPVISQIYDAIKSGLNQFNDIVFVGFDAGDRQIDWIKENSKPLLLGSVAQNSYALGYEAVSQVIKACQGQEVTDKITTDGVWWDINNYEAMIEQKIVYHG